MASYIFPAVRIAMALTVGGAALSGCDNRGQDACVYESINELRSPDHLYSASVQRQTCTAGAEVIFNVIIIGPRAANDSWKYAIHIDNDLRNETAPTVEWTTPSSLIIRVKTRTLVGTLTEHVGQHLTVQREFLPSERNAFPNFF